MKKISTLLLLLFSLTKIDGVAQSWETMSTGLGSSTESVKAIAESPGHEIYAGGTFTGSVSYLAHWTGSSWTAVGSGVNGPVYALAFKNNDLYIGGSFSLAGGVTVSNIAKYNISTGVWSDVGGGFNGQVNCLFVSATSGTLFAGGAFSLSGGNTMNHISKLVSTTWTQIGSGISAVVNSIAEFQNTQWAGCENTSAPVQKYGVSGWVGETGISGGKVYALASFSNNLYAGGDFTTPTFAAARFDGTSWGTIQTTFSPSDKIYAFSARYNTVLYIGGKFTNLGIPGSTASYIARINSPTTPIQTITLTSSTIGGEVYAIGNQSGKVIAGGKFSSPATNVAITSTTIDVNELSDLVINKSFYPNPVVDKAYISISTKERLKNPQIKIFGIQSQLITDLTIERTINNNEINFTVDCSTLPSGNYFYMVTENEKSVVTDHFIVR